MNDEAHCADVNNAGLPANALVEAVAIEGRHSGRNTGGGGMLGLKPGGGIFVLIGGSDGTFTLADSSGGTLTLTGSDGILALAYQDVGRNSPAKLLLTEWWNCATGANGIVCRKPPN